VFCYSIHRVFNQYINMNRKTNRSQEQSAMEMQKASAFYTSVITSALLDLADIHNVSKQESRRDVEEIQHRVANEGLSFLTVTLPSLGKALDRALSKDGGVFACPGFELEPGCQYPKFLRCYWSQILDVNGGILPDAPPLCVKSIRQLAYLLYKLEIPPTEEQRNRVVSEFIEVDSGLPDSFPDRKVFKEMSPAEQVIEIATHIIGKLFAWFNPFDIDPRHGPGAVATGEQNHEKHCFKRIYSDIDGLYSFTEYFLSGANHMVDYWTGMQSALTVKKHGTAKVVLVPKDSRGPRLISCEPLEYQWVQQGLGNGIRAHLEKKSSLAYRQINFADQSVNRNLALLGSMGRGWVTLDMKEASDRVSLALVRRLWRDNPVLLSCLEATRTPETRLPNGDVMPMKKFAPMGSNLCFPVESVVFWALAVATIVNKIPRFWDRCKSALSPILYWKAIKRASKDVYVYGDDIICKSEDYRDLLDMLPNFGLLFNSDKCCTGGSFRESCGMDAFKGHPVQPLRLKRLWSVSRKQDALTIASYVAFRNAAYVHGLHRVAEFITPLIEAEVGTLPVMAWNCSRPPHEFVPTSGLILVEHGTHAGTNPILSGKLRYNKRLQRLEVRCLLPTPVNITVKSGDWSMVLRRLTSPGREAPGVFPLAHRVTLKWAWIHPVS
jgi:hypothetical protein